MLDVPETEQWHGVICPEWMRLPVESMRDVRFPADHARAWSGHYGVRSKGSGARHQQEWTFVDPAFSDPGPAASLPHTGAAPRASEPSSTRNASSRNPSCRTAAALHDTPLGGRRVLALALSGEQQRALDRRLAELGGTTGERVKASLAAVVVSLPRGEGRATSPPGRGARSPGAHRARALDLGARRSYHRARRHVT
ncbi:hypothetical protein U2F26_29945 [Micromonospora sp. 4G57]|uniref:Uncharacterized protein n=1 Tax=Micromonospora sicca TaxID=2202420 RepID=A0ABU5JLS8_9ACTN|nr:MULTISPECIES: hypothetical protein [unclassified Micromonospora]MDZ5446902.1 hypothetical protein [Micromonospora sp. 4G57]MDZ5493580.1 hypothetical protein [Micromonospora sp. 4G53]